MGLDMYLNAERFLWYNETDLKEKVKGVFPDAPGEPKRVQVEVMYWRKANEIHKWFVDNVQDGKDDCGNYYVEVKQLKELQAAIALALEHRADAPHILPTQPGFFFGSTDYDDQYWKSLETTAKRLDEIIPQFESNTDWSLEYHSSW